MSERPDHFEEAAHFTESVPAVRSRGACRGFGVSALTVFAALACSGDPSGPVAGTAPGTFTATASGAIRGTFTGTATFVAQEGNGYEIEMLSSRADGFGLWVTADGSGRPVPGSYTVTPLTAPQTFPTALAVLCANQKSPCYTEWGAHWEDSAGAGHVDITQASSLAVAGTLDVDLRYDVADATGGLPLIHVSARFNATCSLSTGC